MYVHYPSVSTSVIHNSKAIKVVLLHNAADNSPSPPHIGPRRYCPAVLYRFGMRLYATVEV